VVVGSVDACGFSVFAPPVQTEEAVEKEMLLQEKDRMYAEVKGVLARQPGPEVWLCFPFLACSVLSSCPEMYNTACLRSRSS
jgi:hypothetical protein